ncbi:MAG: inositol monophosphatase [Candidatus Obscuribacter sp.]|nr:inositol monophosphatase [Candidatus Obscuribacter sp.]MBL0187365.1 inositol monophosphatase [Candidatus Obscuribacter sp.]MBP6595552.1 inositol monophosphatase [Candidatus Obscuribacter sp.]MBP7575789.1 inositol monophosphatase [Candidatus Obscuribacter sp.]
MKNTASIAREAALKAGALQKSRLGKIKSLDYKSAFNIVTDVDKACEALIIETILEAFPDDGFLAEESGTSGVKKSHRRWIIDPLDGTTNFAHTYPFFCVSIGLEEDGKLIMGTVYNAIADELFTAERGQGAYLNEQKITVSASEKLETSLLATGFPPDTVTSDHSNMESYRNLTNASHGVRRDGSAALDLCFVASGRLDGFWERKLAPWDVAAGSVIVEEAGGKVTNLEDGPLDMESGHILATNGKIHQEIVEMLAKVKAISAKG